MKTWHDLRHEYASRLVEKGVPLAQVRGPLGHASITTTERYDNQKLENLQTAVLKVERGFAFNPEGRSGDLRPTVGPERAGSMTERPSAATSSKRHTTKTRCDDRDNVSSFFQDQATVPAIEGWKAHPEIDTKLKSVLFLESAPPRPRREMERSISSRICPTGRRTIS